MKTIPLLLIPCFPLLGFSQTAPSTNAYPIVAKGEALINQKHPDSALYLAQKTLAQVKANSFEQRQAYFLLGKVKFEMGDPDAAIHPFQKSLGLSEKQGDEHLQLRSLIGLTAALGDKENPEIDSAMFYLETAEYLAKKHKDTLSLYRVYTNRSNLLNLDGDYEAALANTDLNEALLKNTTLEYEKGINSYARANILMESFYKSNDRILLNKAKDAFEFSIAAFQKSKRGIKKEAHARNGLGGCLLYFDDLEAAEDQIKQSIKLGLELDDDGILLNSYYNLSSLYEMQNNESAAIIALEKLNELMNATGKRGDVAFIKEQFSNNDIKISSALIKNKISIFNKQLENRKLQNRMLWGGFSAILMIAFFVGLYWYTRQKNRLHIQQKKLLQEKVDNLSKSREIEFMQARLEGEAKGRLRIAQQIHDGVGGLLISTKWNLESALKELSKTENKVASRLKENLKLQEHSYIELRRVMYELERSDKPWWEELEQFCKQLAQHKNVSIHYYPYNLDENAGGKLGEEVRLVIQELITNALKHANAKEINIQVSQIEGELDVIVEDDGIGFDQLKLIKGIGMRSIEERVERLGGKYSIETKEGKGTIVFMDVPLKTQNATDRPQATYASAN